MEQKRKPEFSRSFWGYDPAQVEEYIKSLANVNDENTTALVTRLKAVLAECSDLSAELLENARAMEACTEIMQHLLFLSESLLDLGSRNNREKIEFARASLHIEEHLSSLKKELTNGKPFTGPANPLKGFSESIGIDDQDINQKLEDVYAHLISLKQNLAGILAIASAQTSRLVKYEMILNENLSSYEIIKRAIRKAVLDHLAEELPPAGEETPGESRGTAIPTGEPDLHGKPEAGNVKTAASPYPETPDRADTAVQAEGSTGTAMVVDDSPTIRAIVRAVLEREGYEVIEAADGKEALEIVRNKPPCSLVILDLMLPYADGREITKAIRDNPDWCRVPVIILSLSTAEQDIVGLFEAGASDYVPKPFSPLELGARIRRFKYLPCSKQGPGS